MREPSKDVLCVKVDPEPGDLIPVQPVWVPAGGTGPGGCHPGARTPLACLAVMGRKLVRLYINSGLAHSPGPGSSHRAGGRPQGSSLQGFPKKPSPAGSRRSRIPELFTELAPSRRGAHGTHSLLEPLAFPQSTPVQTGCSPYPGLLNSNKGANFSQVPIPDLHPR